jgi:hypothetical protein
MLNCLRTSRGGRIPSQNKRPNICMNGTWSACQELWTVCFPKGLAQCEVLQALHAGPPAAVLCPACAVTSAPEVASFLLGFEEGLWQYVKADYGRRISENRISACMKQRDWRGLFTREILLHIVFRNSQLREYSVILNNLPEWEILLADNKE